MPRLRSTLTGVIVNVDDTTAAALADSGAAGEWVDADKAEKPARHKSSKSE
ncbi:DUF7302 family protein [Sinomonas susongensis]|uniref:DUF7302 family protein n=1 Tax=Sinomonas susongensis TaxID=1324851 RepID=UPI0014871E0C|nr:hypothetical protein [Sinomonas susongensis]